MISIDDKQFWCVYLLKCNDKTIYTGCTSNLTQRLHAHRNGEVHYTKTRLPFDLVTYIAFDNKYSAYNFEKYLKSGSGKAFANKRFLSRGEDA
jgi:putative endonuclease